jgi:hypothetical protein
VLKGIGLVVHLEPLLVADHTLTRKPCNVTHLRIVGHPHLNEPPAQERQEAAGRRAVRLADQT